MRKMLAAIWMPLLLIGGLALPASAAATSGFSYTIVNDSCGRPYGWTNHFKVKAIADGTTAANKITIDSWAQVKSFPNPHPHWITGMTWSQASTSYTRDGSGHSLEVGRHYTGGGIEQAGRIVMKLRAWHNSTLLWSQKVTSSIC